VEFILAEVQETGALCCGAIRGPADDGRDVQDELGFGEGGAAVIMGRWVFLD
jgi:hypothetical protein